MGLLLTITNEVVYEESIESLTPAPLGQHRLGAQVLCSDWFKRSFKEMAESRFVSTRSSETEACKEEELNRMSEGCERSRVLQSK